MGKGREFRKAPGHSWVWEGLRFRRKKTSSLLNNPFKKIERNVRENNLRDPNYLVIDYLHGCSKYLITRHRRRIG